MRPPIAAYGFVVLIGRSSSGVIFLASLRFPVALDFDVFRATAILLAGLF